MSGKAAEDAIKIQNDLAASFGAVEEWSDKLAPSLDDLAEAQAEGSPGRRMICAKAQDELKQANKDHAETILADDLVRAVEASLKPSTSWPRLTHQDADRRGSTPP